MASDDDTVTPGAEITVGLRLVGWFRRTVLRRPEPTLILRRRAEIREEIRQNLRWPSSNEVPEVLVVNHRRYDTFGELDTRVIGRGASDWFKTEVKGLHDRGLEVYMSIEYAVIRRSKARRVRDEQTHGARKVWVVGRIPFERIAYIDWEPDPNYGTARFYIIFRWWRNPYREVVLYEGSPREYLYEMVGVTYVGEGGGPVKRLRRFIQHVRFNLGDRRQGRTHPYDTE
jgi:hypothetical protein